MSGGLTHKGVQQLRGLTREVAQFLWNFSQESEWVIPSIVPFEETGACVNWEDGIIVFILESDNVKEAIVEIDSVVTLSFVYPLERNEILHYCRVLNKI